jgi:ribosomal protein RSM22 (predicted rRNA methylase)
LTTIFVAAWLVASVPQRRNAEQEAHDSLVTQNQGLEREYQRFEKKQKLMKSIQVRSRTRTAIGRLIHNTV